MSRERAGRLTDWNDERGFGYITPLGGGPTIFVHVSEFPRDKRRPMLTDLVTYSVGTDKRGRTHAQGVAFLTPTSPSHRESPVSTLGVLTSLAVSLGFMIVVLGLVASRVAPIVVPVVYFVLSVVTFAAYGWDKYEAESGGWRTRESTLHAFSLAGGWPGALVAQNLFRHKNRKPSFQFAFWLTVAGNCGLLALVLVELAMSG
jgi:uncharacterized membrane protein YsdA (DUF1294 family)/cold shock CspA family protein